MSIKYSKFGREATKLTEDISRYAAAEKRRNNTRLFYIDLDFLMSPALLKPISLINTYPANTSHHRYHRTYNEIVHFVGQESRMPRIHEVFRLN